MKIFLFTTTTGDAWEMCSGAYLVIAESKEEARILFKYKSPAYEDIESIEEIDLSVKGCIEIQNAVVE